MIELCVTSVISVASVLKLWTYLRRKALTTEGTEDTEKARWFANLDSHLAYWRDSDFAGCINAQYTTKLAANPTNHA